MPLEIRAKRDGFRRCGMAHSTTPTVHPDGTFTPAQVAILLAEPMLVVTEVAQKVAPETPESPKSAPKRKTKARVLPPPLEA